MDCDGVLDQSCRACDGAAIAWTNLCASSSCLYARHRRRRAPASCCYEPGHLCPRTRTSDSAANSSVRTVVCAARIERVLADGAVVGSRFAAMLRTAKLIWSFRLRLD